MRAEPAGGVRIEIGEEENPFVAVAIGVVVTLTLTVAFTLMALGFPLWWVVFPVGFGGLIPVAIGITEWYTVRDADRRAGGGPPTAVDPRRDSGEGALATLRDRYARGIIDEDEFERRLGTLLETESVGDARRYAERGRRTGTEHAPAEPVGSAFEPARERV